MVYYKQHSQILSNARVHIHDHTCSIYLSISSIQLKDGLGALLGPIPLIVRNSNRCCYCNNYVFMCIGSTQM